MSVVDPGPGRTSPESGDILAMPDLVSNFDLGPGEPLLKSGVGLDMPNLDSDFDILQMPDFVSAINSGPGTTSPESGDILAMPDFVSDNVFAFVAARVQFDPAGPGFVTTLAHRTPDVIQLCPSSSGSGLSTLLSSAGMLISPVSALLRAIERYKLGARKGPLYGYACVRCWYSKGLYAAIDGLLIDVACCLCCLVVLLCCAGLSDRVFRCSGCHTCSPGVSRGCPG